MGIKIFNDGRMSGQSSKFLAYEKKILNGSLPCPFKVEFRDTQFAKYEKPGCSCYLFKKKAGGKVISSSPMPLTENGAPKRKLFA